MFSGWQKQIRLSLISGGKFFYFVSFMLETPRLICNKLLAYAGRVVEGKDLRMTALLSEKLAWVRQVGSETGKSMASVENLVLRQLRQNSSGVPVAKSGSSD